MFPLSSVSFGRYQVVSINGGPGMVNRLASMGIVPGTVVDVIKPSPGKVIVVIPGRGRFGMGKGMASRIMVRQVR